MAPGGIRQRRRVVYCSTHVTSEARKRTDCRNRTQHKACTGQFGFCRLSAMPCHAKDLPRCAVLCIVCCAVHCVLCCALCAVLCIVCCAVHCQAPPHLVSVVCLLHFCHELGMARQQPPVHCRQLLVGHCICRWVEVRQVAQQEPGAHKNEAGKED
jgi:hypothetical protein